MLVYRVNLLCAKAHFHRWDEELKTVHHEMKWCVLYSRNIKKTWIGQKNMGGDGHQVYASKQAEIWKKFEMEGVVRFRGKMVA